jgi:hypothetical protein
MQVFLNDVRIEVGAELTCLGVEVSNACKDRWQVLPPEFGAPTIYQEEQ